MTPDGRGGVHVLIVSHILFLGLSSLSSSSSSASDLCCYGAAVSSVAAEEAAPKNDESGCDDCSGRIEDAVLADARSSDSSDILCFLISLGFVRQNYLKCGRQVHCHHSPLYSITRCLYFFSVYGNPLDPPLPVHSCPCSENQTQFFSLCLSLICECFCIIICFPRKTNYSLPRHWCYGV